MDLCDLNYSISRTPSPYCMAGKIDVPYEILPQSMIKTVNKRDHNTCRFCGFEDTAPQKAVLLGENIFDLNDVFTACIFCHQVMNLDIAVFMKSAVLVWLPEISQIDLHHIARQLYCWRMSGGLKRHRALELNEKIKLRQQQAKEKAGTDQLADILKEIDSQPGCHGGKFPQETFQDLRVLPLDRRIESERGMQFNIFPALLNRWRSKPGAMNLPSASRHPGVRQGEEILYSERELSKARQPPACASEPPPVPEFADTVQQRPDAAMAADQLHQAAQLLKTIARHVKRTGLRQELLEISVRCLQAASLIRLNLEKPAGPVTDKKNSHLRPAVIVLREVAAICATIADQNAALKDQMKYNSRVFTAMAELLESDPSGSPPAE